MNKILVVDDELSIRESFSLILDGGKYRIVTAASGEGALKHVADQKIDLVYLDIRMPGLDGLETLKRIKELNPDIDVIMVTAVNDTQKASEAVKLGARDYLIKPFDVEAIRKMTESILGRRRLMLEGEAVQKEAHKKTPQLIGRNEKIIEITKLIDRIAPKNLRVLIVGEPGTEKEEASRAIHRQSTRADLPFLSFHLSARSSLPSVKAKLFGSEKGSTVYDLKKTAGLLEKVRGGTLFLNHIAYLGLEPELFKAADARLIAGSNLAAAPEGSKEIFDFFSEALIVLPPLRERISDLPLLIDHFVEKFSTKYGKEIGGLAAEAEEILSNYDWPGNTEELSSVVERLVLNTSSEQIPAAELPVDLLLKSSGAPGSEYLSGFERIYVRKIFEETGGDREKAASILQISPALLEGKL